MSVTIYYNPRCSTSRATLNLLRERGVEPVVIEYLMTPPTVEELTALLGLLGLSARQILRKKDAKAVGLEATGLEETALIAAMVENPAVIERPIVVANGRAVLGRPPEKVLELL
ncbi:MAG: arsenate reductase [Rhodospirillaceae bacterium]|nr:MAG: arsenate reductase [Rhodospirillaceae bacterium]